MASSDSRRPRRRCDGQHSIEGRDDHGPGAERPAPAPAAEDGADATEATIDGQEPGPAAATVRHWGRFRQVRRLGSGGMGEVFEAHDPHLDRRVAVKVLRDDRPEAVQRFIREARAQARVAHELVCPIHEVGEADGKPYIVMQLIRGRTLAEAAPEMSLEQKVLIVQQVATAVHEAHRAGLIHRDIKPGNIMVEETADGTLKPYVMDFGIAHPLAEEGMTTEGAFLGTLAYSAPEQVRGERGAIDRRTDVYALGATLYAVLSGSPPYSGPTPTVLEGVLNLPPQLLRPAGIPADLETIVLTCLEKEPEQRYGSARSLAEELQRILDGEPILARPVGLLTRLLRLARRHKRVSAVLTAAVILVGLALAWGISTRWQARARERLVRSLSDEVAGIEAQVRYSHMSPRHDIRPDREGLRSNMAAIRAEVEEAGAIAEGPGNYALGRGHLALGELELARHHLELAWAAGYREPEVAHALGMTLSLQYRERLAETDVITDPDLRGQRRQALQQEYERPALAFLEQSQGLDPQARSHLAALIALHQGQLDRALDLLGEPGARHPWSYESRKLEGDILRQRAMQRHEAGDAEGAPEDIEQARLAYEAAQEIAASDPGIYLAAGALQYLLAQRSEFSGGNLQQHIDQGLREAGLALEVLPDDRAWILEARLHQKMAEWHRNRQEDPSADLEFALRAATRAAELTPDASLAWKVTSAVYSSWAHWFNGQGDSERQAEMIAKALAALGEVAEAEHDYSFFNALGVAHGSLGDLHARQGEDARGDYKEALAAYRLAVELHPRPRAACSNLGLYLRKLAVLPGVENRSELLKEAIGAFERVREIDPDGPVAYYYQGLCSLALAQDGNPFSGKLGAAADQAIEYYRQGRERNPKMPHFYSGIGEVLHLKAQQAWDRGGNAEALFEQAEAVYRQGIEVGPRFSFLHLNLAWNSCFRGKYLVREGKSPGDYLRLAIEEANHAQEIAAHDGAVLCIGSAYQMLAEYELVSGRDPEVNLDRARAEFTELVRRNPENVSAHRGLGALAITEARWLARNGDDPLSAFAIAARALGRALEIMPERPYVHLVESRRCLLEAQWSGARGKPVAQLVNQGLAHADQALEIRQGWAEVLAVRACLLLFKARSSSEHRPELERQATMELERALTSNPHLAFEWGSCLVDGR